MIAGHSVALHGVRQSGSNSSRKPAPKANNLLQCLLVSEYQTIESKPSEQDGLAGGVQTALPTAPAVGTMQPASEGVPTAVPAAAPTDAPTNAPTPAAPRIEYIDIAKGIGIILVVAGHVVFNDRYPMPDASIIANFLFSFHMPLFFVLAGLCIKDTKVLNSEVFLKLVVRYLVPFIIWSLIYLGVFQWEFNMDGLGPVLDPKNYHYLRFTTLCGFAPLWFLLVLFLSELLFMVLKGRKQHSGGYWLAVMAILIALTVITDNQLDYTWDKETTNTVIWVNIMSVCRALPACFFVCVGYLAKKPLVKLAKVHGGYRFALLILLWAIQVILCAVRNDPVDLHLYQLGDPALYFIKALNGSLATIVLCQFIHSKVLAYVGKKSKEIMILHYPPFMFAKTIGDFLTAQFFEPCFGGFVIITFASVIACLAIDFVFCRLTLWKIMMGTIGVSLRKKEAAPGETADDVPTEGCTETAAEVRLETA